MTGSPTKSCGIMISEIVIVRHPVHVCAPVNYKLTLSVRAEGTGILNYQWFTEDEKELPGGTEADLTITSKKKEQYVCRVNDHFCNCVFSDWVTVKVLDIDKSGLPVHWQGELHIAVNPKPQTVRKGSKLTLQCAAFGIPAPHYQWYRNGRALLDKTSGTLQINRASAEHEGSYLCSISNVLQETWTEPVHVDIVQTDHLPPAATTATDKVALLIGNLNYSHLDALMAPVMDVHELANLLQQLGFRVVSLLDLNRDEMLAAIDMFIQLLDRGVYGLFYYAGHGYEHAGRNYLVAVDAPQPYRQENCVCVQRVMLSMQERQTALSVMLLDTCRKWYNQDCLPSSIMPLGPSGNTVYGYATCEDAVAYEVQDGGKSTGIFTKYLNTHILQTEKVTHVLERVSEDLGKDPLVTGKQQVEIKHTLKEPRSLADPVRTTGHTRELHMRDASWRQANVLPRKKQHIFVCGVEVEVSFSALFSNVLVAFATIKTTGPRTQDCTVTLSSIPPMEDIFSGPGKSDEMDTLLLSKPGNPDCILRLCALQKLTESLIIKVDLHYTNMDNKLRRTESQLVDIGKPLVASCKLHRRNHATTAKKQEGASAQNMGNRSSCKPRLHQTMAGPCRPFTRKAECAAKVAVTRSNEPEENDENELQDSTHRR
ncbi:mucosa-associated lymphoid tissue lymphoma translocation protein 1 [Cottoperca gobio]|uniref:Mucosa-associated lymphoid tissue lymphoma translocation protein 1-like n=1 Tax=Cottoperca gobio TaxID=56716 RepID=A0A6J2PZE6_COTGO|nr:mucosa-associated lymphoid tissue lymphoma translocation protein 1-like [Cottoperca gobio]XP_029290747.1 mucosa-associated lymphoid tissue lymphoma translocation protein 1-like [Cottoperca gobio]XP_029290748.1 mucosa-associated lymphoid tissue lymphoma translocation protein 1-like [Cottoperca gobio]XP_029290749.1 mucosa-associated lymphoid tissue lymphoma translocation protein 1-like [Cottoperca gobio]